MTIRKLSNLCVILGAALLSVGKAAERAETFSEALSKAGSDGVIAYCYGPDWNRRSVRLLKTFWNTPEAAEATPLPAPSQEAAPVSETGAPLPDTDGETHEQMGFDF